MKLFLLRNLLVLAVGVLLLSVSVYVTISLVSYDINDPSFNKANSSTDIANWGGELGAFIADPILQFLGLSVISLLLLLLIWSVNLILGSKLLSLVTRIPLVLTSTALVAATLDYWFIPSEDWLFTVNLGGIIGSQIVNKIYFNNGLYNILIHIPLALTLFIISSGIRFKKYWYLLHKLEIRVYFHQNDDQDLYQVLQLF